MSFTLRRKAARAVVLDPEGRILLIRAHDPADHRPHATRRHWWELPGGGIDPGEPTEHCVQRELWEEAGITDATIGPVVWTQHVTFTFAGWHFDQDEWIHIAHCPTPPDSLTPGGLETLEAIAFEDRVWWTLEQVQTAADNGERFIPYRLAEFLGDLIDADRASVTGGTPVDITPGPEHISAWQTDPADDGQR